MESATSAEQDFGGTLSEGGAISNVQEWVQYRER